MSGRFGPLAATEAAANVPCHICETPLRVGDFYDLVPVEPANSAERAAMLAGRPYNARAELAHADCAEWWRARPVHDAADDAKAQATDAAR